FRCSPDPVDLHSFPTRRSSDLAAVWMIVSNNSPQGAAFFNSSNSLVGYLLKQQADVVQFFSLAEANEALTNENAEALQKLLLLQDRKSTRLNSSHVKISYAVFC